MRLGLTFARPLPLNNFRSRSPGMRAAGPDRISQILTDCETSSKETPMAVRKLDTAVVDARTGVRMKSDPSKIDPLKLKLGKSVARHDPRLGSVL
jgi:hypothetical protein